MALDFKQIDDSLLKAVLSPSKGFDAPNLTNPLARAKWELRGSFYGGFVSNAYTEPTLSRARYGV